MRGRTHRRARCGRWAVVVAAAAILAACQQAPSLAEQKVQTDSLINVDATAFASRANDSLFTSNWWWLDWSTDGCSNGPDTGAWFDFHNPCWHHDFGYRNYKRFNRGGIIPNPEASRKRIDDMFYDDMKAHCSGRAITLRPACSSTALSYYTAVRNFGSIA